MLFVVRQLKFGHYWLRECLKSNLWTKRLCVNLNCDSRYHKHYCTRAELSVPEKNIKKYIKTVCDAYTSKYAIDENFKAFIERYDAVALLEKRLDIENNIKSLEELGK